MRISVILPTQLYKFSYPSPLSMLGFPVGVAYVAAALKAAGHEVAGCNPNNIYGFPSAKAMMEHTVARHLDERQPQVVCLGGLCTDYAFLKDCIQLVRAKKPDVPIILGGSIVTHDADFVFERLRPDFAVLGDGEQVATQLVASIAAGIEPKQVPNILYWKNGQAQATEENFCCPPIAALPYPLFEIFDVKRIVDDFSLAAPPPFRFPHADPHPWVMVTGRGCPFRCTFCVHERRPTPYRTRPIMDVMSELEHFHNQYHFNILAIMDELFAAKRSRLVEFSEAIKKLRQDRKWDLKWTFQTHANAGFTEEDIALAREAGCYLFIYGVESASETVLASMKKRMHPRQIADVIPMCYKAKVGFGANFIFGDPAETPETVKETLTFFRDNCENVHAGLGSIQPYPGSTLYINCLQNKTIPDAAQFYETIDERRYCMTPGFSEKPWLFWGALLGFLGVKGLYHKAAPAVVCAHETTSYFDILLLEATCPHCGSHFTYRHAQVLHQTKNATMYFWQTKLLLWVPKVKHHRLFTWLVLRAVALISLRHRWFGYLKYTVRPGPRAGNGTVAGCPECNQCVRLEWWC